MAEPIMGSAAAPAQPRHSRIAVIGAGFGGIATGLRLLAAGHDDFVIFDRGDDVGGTWRDNTYPGCACDVPSHMYSLSFMPNPENPVPITTVWTRMPPPRAAWPPTLLGVGYFR